MIALPANPAQIVTPSRKTPISPQTTSRAKLVTMRLAQRGHARKLSR